jgi:hypothetical protein
MLLRKSGHKRKQKQQGAAGIPQNFSWGVYGSLACVLIKPDFHTQAHLLLNLLTVVLQTVSRTVLETFWQNLSSTRLGEVLKKAGWLRP